MDLHIFCFLYMWLFISMASYVNGFSYIWLLISMDFNIYGNRLHRCTVLETVTPTVRMYFLHVFCLTDAVETLCVWRPSSSDHLGTTCSRMIRTNRSSVPENMQGTESKSRTCSCFKDCYAGCWRFMRTVVPLQSVGRRNICRSRALHVSPSVESPRPNPILRSDWSISHPNCSPPGRWTVPPSWRGGGIGALIGDRCLLYVSTPRY